MMRNLNLKVVSLQINKWIILRFSRIQQKVIKNLEDYKFNLVISELYQFIWNDFCDLYLELSKFYLKEDKNKNEISGTFNYVFKNP